MYLLLALFGCGEKESAETIPNPEPVILPLLVEQVVVMPYTAVTSDSYLQCIPTITGAEIATLQIDYQWVNVRSEEVLGYTYALQLDVAMVDANDEVQCVVSAVDEREEPSENSSSVIIEHQIFHADDLPVSFMGERPSDMLGSALTAIGDVDNDGSSEFLFSAPFNSLEEVKGGKTYLLGSIEDSVEQPLQSFYGERIKDYAGSSLSSAGDIDVDGRADILIGAPGSDINGLDAGSVYLFYAENFLFGGVTGISLAEANRVFSGEQPGDDFGASIVSVGDLNGDLSDDFLISAPSNKDGGYNAGKVYIYAGDSILSDEQPKSFVGEFSYGKFGTTMVSAGDVNGDGLSDVWISAPGDSSSYGKAYLISGENLLFDDIEVGWADVTLTGEATGDMFGSAMATGDVDGDGLSDILVGAPFSNDIGYMSGKAYLVFSSHFLGNNEFAIQDADYSFVAEASDNSVGASVAIVDDIYGDGIAEVLIAAPGNSASDSYAGKVYLHPSEDFGLDQEVQLSTVSRSFVGDNLYDEVGTTVANIGDIDNDGKGDFLIGSPQANHGGSDSGTVYILLGSHL